MAETITLPEEQTEERTKRQPPYHVILLNDDDHTYQYVIHMLQALFGHPPETGFKMAEEVDTKGRVIVDTTSMERAELKQRPDSRLRPRPTDTALQGEHVGGDRAGGVMSKRKKIPQVCITRLRDWRFSQLAYFASTLR